MRCAWIAALAVTLTVTLMPGRASADPCLASRRSPHCSSFYVTEFGYAFKLTSPLRNEYFTAVGDSITSAYEYRVAGRHLLHSELGLMYNLGPDYAVGFSHVLGWDAGHILFGGVKLRARRWLSDQSSIDVSGGAILWSSEGDLIEQPSFIGSASMSFSHWQRVDLIVTSMSTRPFEYIYYDTGGVPTRSFSPRNRELGVHLGHTLGAKPGLVLNGVALVTSAIVVGVIIGSLANSN